MNIEKVKRVDKEWGVEVWLVNTDLYCGKLLLLDKGATSSYHYHMTKTETFACLDGEVDLTINGEEFILNNESPPMTIEPWEKHQFHGVADSVIIEISTTHEDKDVVREVESKGG